MVRCLLNPFNARTFQNNLFSLIFQFWILNFDGSEKRIQGYNFLDQKKKKESQHLIYSQGLKEGKEFSLLGNHPL